MAFERQRAKKQYGNRRRIDFLRRKNGHKRPTKSAWVRHCAALGQVVHYKGNHCHAWANDPAKVERPSEWVGDADRDWEDEEMTAEELKKANAEYDKVLAGMKGIPIANKTDSK